MQQHHWKASCHDCKKNTWVKYTVLSIESIYSSHCENMALCHHSGIHSLQSCWRLNSIKTRSKRLSDYFYPRQHIDLLIICMIFYWHADYAILRTVLLYCSAMQLHAESWVEMYQKTWCFLNSNLASSLVTRNYVIYSSLYWALCDINIVACYVSHL